MERRFPRGLWYIDFSKKYPAEIVTNQTGNVGTELIQLNKLAMNLVDHLIIKPDPQAAARLPEDYVLPTASDLSVQIESTRNLSPSEILAILEKSMESIRNSQLNFKTLLDSVIKVTSDPNSTSDMMLEAINNMKISIE